MPKIILPVRPPRQLPAAGELTVEDGIIYHGLLTGKVVGVISPANVESRRQWEPALRAHADVVMPEDAERHLVYDCFVSAIQGMVAFGLTIPFSGQDGLRCASVVTLQGGNPLNYLYHEAAHLHLREGRISADEFAFYRDASTVAQLGKRYELDRYSPGRRPEEALAHLCGEWGAGADFEDGGISAGVAATERSPGRGPGSAGELRPGERFPPSREEIARACGLPDAQIRFLEAMVAGEIGRRPVELRARLAWLHELGLRPSNEHFFGAHPAEIGLARQPDEISRDRKPERDRRGWER